MLIPILTLPFWLFYFEITPKVAALLISLAIACAMAPQNARAILSLWNRRDGKRAVWLIALLALTVTISTVFSTQTSLSIGGTNWRCFGLVTQSAVLAFTLLIAANLSSNAVRISTILRAIAVSGSAIALYAILQYLGWDPLLSPATYHIGEGVWTIVRPPGTIGHADYLGSYLVFVMFLGGSLWMRESQREWRIVGVACAVLSAFAIILSGTRSAILAASCGVALLLFWLRPSVKKMSLGLSLALVALAGFYFSPMGLKLRGRTRWYVEDARGGARLLLWRDSLQLALNHVPFGGGPETFGANFPQYQSLELARAFPDFYHESPHNIFLEELTEQGVVGLVLFLAWTGFALRSAWRISKRSQADAIIGAALFAGLISLQFNAFVLTTAFFFYLTSVLVLHLDTEAESEQPAATPSRPLAAFAVGIPLAILFAFAAVRLVVADAALATVRTRLEAGNVMAAASRYEMVRRWEPRTGSSDAYYSRNMSAIIKRQSEVYNAVKAWQEAIQSGIRSTKLAEDPQNADYQLASIYAQGDNRKDAEKYLRAAIQRAPNWFKPHWILARLLHSSGRRPEALAEALAAVERDGGKHPEVTETLGQFQQDR